MHHPAGSVLVVGLGRFGGALARTLIELGTEVLAVDSDARLVQMHSIDLPHVAQVDATDLVALRQLGAHEFDTAVVAIGAGVESSVLVTTALLDLGIERVWAKAISDQHAKILERVGAHRVFRPEAEMGARVAHLVSGRVLEYLSLDEGFVLAEVVAPPSFVGRALGDIGLRATYRVTVVCVKHPGSTFTYAESSTIVRDGDLLVLAGAPGDVERFAQVR
ncbi:MAG: TrkA family potassium uptake protein [Actinobacteria bacterium]|nr:TrkA family potassium uptake protein [Actinomycetota bacterium]